DQPLGGHCIRTREHPSDQSVKRFAPFVLQASKPNVDRVTAGIDRECTSRAILTHYRRRIWSRLNRGRLDAPQREESACYAYHVHTSISRKWTRTRPRPWPRVERAGARQPTHCGFAQLWIIGAE